MASGSCEEVVALGSTPINPKKESDGAGSSPSGRTSPETNCPICLGKLENKSFTDSCLHQFCFTCLLEWSKVKAECPLCKQSFKSIIHNVRSIEDYEQYYLSTTSTEGTLLGIIARYQPSQPREPFRYRTTAVSSYLDYFVRLEEAISHHVIPSVPTHSSTTHWHRRRQNGTSDFRRNIYQHGLWVQRTTDITGRVRDCSPEFYRSNPALVHRLVPWLNRELNVLCEGQVQEVMSRIMDLITRVAIRSPAFTAAISPYIGRHTEHFVHEFYSFAASPYDLIGYDRHAGYVGRDLLAHIETPIEDSDDSDIQIVSPSTPAVLSPPRSIHLDSDSDECVVVEESVLRRPSPEVITLDSDDELLQVNIRINTDPGPSRRRSDNVNVSINIAHNNRSISPSLPPSPPSLSSSSWSPERRRPVKAKSKKKKSKDKKATKSKVLRAKDKKKVKEQSGSNERSPSPVVVPRKRRPSVVLQSSDDDNVLHIVTDQSSLDYSSSSSDVSEYRPRLRSVVIKSNIKQEPRHVSLDISPPRSEDSWEDSNSGSHDNKYVPKNFYFGFNPEIPECSTSNWSDSFKRDRSRHSTSYSSSSSERLQSKKCKHSKKRMKKERH